MSAPDEMVEAVAQALDDAAGAIALNLYPSELASTTLARAVLSVPALAEVIARDAKVRAEVDETRARCEREQLGHDGTMWEAADLGVAIAALYPEAGKPDDSDIMPGSEFDGPVVL